MNYINLTELEASLKLNVNGDVNGNFYFDIYKDGSDTKVFTTPTNTLTDYGYYQTFYIDLDGVGNLVDETQYNLIGFNESGKVVYRGKFQTTSKDLNNLSVNEGKYIKKTTATNYTILD